MLRNIYILQDVSKEHKSDFVHTSRKDNDICSIISNGILIFRNLQTIDALKKINAYKAHRLRLKSALYL